MQVIPIVQPGLNDHVFCKNKDGKTHVFLVTYCHHDGSNTDSKLINLNSGYIRNRALFDMLSASADPQLLEAGLIDKTDILGQDFRVSSFAIGTADGAVQTCWIVPEDESDQFAFRVPKDSEPTRAVISGIRRININGRDQLLELSGDITFKTGAVRLTINSDPWGDAAWRIVGYTLKGERVNSILRPKKESKEIIMKLVPVVRQGNDKFFCRLPNTGATYIVSENIDEKTTVQTGFLRSGMTFNLLDISTTNDGIAVGIVETADTIDPNICVHAVAIGTPDGVIHGMHRLSSEEKKNFHFNRWAGSRNLVFLKEGNKTIKWKDEEFIFSASGVVDLLTGEAEVNFQKQEDPSDLKSEQKYAVIGYQLEAYRIRANQASMNPPKIEEPVAKLLDTVMVYDDLRVWLHGVLANTDHLHPIMQAVEAWTMRQTALGFNETSVHVKEEEAIHNSLKSTIYVIKVNTLDIVDGIEFVLLKNQDRGFARGCAAYFVVAGKKLPVPFLSL